MYILNPIIKLHFYETSVVSLIEVLFNLHIEKILIRKWQIFCFNFFFQYIFNKESS